MLGREIVAFRTHDGTPVAMDARCSHFGANLGNGKIVGDTIQCPYHGWRYGPDGRCSVIPSGCPIPDFARQKTYAVQERHGNVFLFNGAAPSFPLPWFLDVGEEGFVASRPFEFTTESAWPSVTGHAFDLQHFLFVHDRRLLEPPVIDTPVPYVRRISYRAEVVPANWRDKVLSRVGGRIVNASLVIWGGTFGVITAAFERFTSRFMMMMTPIDPRTTRCQGIVYGRGSWPLALELRRYFTKAYLVEEHQSLGKTASMPNRFVESDEPLRDYFRFLERTFEAGEM
jgi:nitrite reductase/ring-hydroxylating ferredoxin subunit